KHPEDPWYRKTLATAWNNLANFLEVWKRDLGEAEAAHRRQVEIASALVGEEPGNPHLVAFLALGHNNLGDILLQTNRFEAAESEIGQARDAFARLAADYPQVPLYREHLAGVQKHLGDLFQQTGRTVDAEREYHQAVAERETVARVHPDVPDYRLGL